MFFASDAPFGHHFALAELSGHWQLELLRFGALRSNFKSEGSGR